MLTPRQRCAALVRWDPTRAEPSTPRRRTTAVPFPTPPRNVHAIQTLPTRRAAARQPAGRCGRRHPLAGRLRRRGRHGGHDGHRGAGPGRWWGLRRRGDHPAGLLGPDRGPVPRQLRPAVRGAHGGDRDDRLGLDRGHRPPRGGTRRRAALRRGPDRPDAGAPRHRAGAVPAVRHRTGAQRRRQLPPEPARHDGLRPGVRHPVHLLGDDAGHQHRARRAVHDLERAPGTNARAGLHALQPVLHVAVHLRGDDGGGRGHGPRPGS